MIICGADLSMNGSGLFKSVLDDDLNYVSFSSLGFSTIKKICQESKNIVHYKREQFNNDLEKHSFFADNISKFVNDCNYVAIEGASFASKGILFNIGEFTGIIKKVIYDNKIKMRIYDPNSVKCIGCGIGNATKGDMYNSFLKVAGELANLEIKNLPPLEESEHKKGKSPLTDLVDAYFLMEFLRLELKLRRGLIELKNLPEKTIAVFNRVSKKYPINLLDTKFI